MAEEYVKQVTLPSKGIFYEDKIPEGLVNIEPMGTREEKLFASGTSGSLVIDKVFSSCVDCPIPPLDLVLGDRLFLLLQIRSISYGDEYSFPFRCSECNEKAWGSVSISKLPIRYAKEGSSSTFSMLLPILGNEIEVRFLTGKDEIAVQRYVKQIASKRGKAGEAEYVYRFARRIESIDGQSVGIREAMELFESLKGEDSIYFRDEISEYEVGPELEIEVPCNYCNYLNGPMFMPMDTEFFRPRKRNISSGNYIATAAALEHSD